MVVVVCGSRQWGADKKMVALLDKEVSKRMSQLPPDAVIVSGGAAGADTILDKAAARLGLDRIILPANWTKYGKRAGYLRNVAMLGFNPDLVLAYRYPGSTRGTNHTITEAKERKLPVEVYELGMDGIIKCVEKHNITEADQ